MANAGEDIGGGCCLAITASLQSWCDQKFYGSGSQAGQAGCCGSCFKKSFDEDDFENRPREGAAPVSAQPAAQKAMEDKPAAAPPQ